MKTFKFGTYIVKIDEEQKIADVYEGVAKIVTVVFHSDDFYNRTIQALVNLSQLSKRLSKLPFVLKGT